MSAVAFRIEKLRDAYFVPVLVDDHGRDCFRFSACACADQAASCATRGGSRPLPYLGMRERRAGEWVDTDDRSCSVDRRSWTWTHHGWTHGTLRRMERLPKPVAPSPAPTG